MQDNIFAFIILHYQSLDYTNQCIESILQLDDQQHIRIVVVDNASPNGSGAVLASKYAGSDQIEIILNDNNDGFSRANNIGCEAAYNMWKPQFYIVANNDVIFQQTDILSIINREYESSHFHVLGPDIYDITHKVHQNPMGMDIPTRSQAFKTMMLNGICLKTLFISYPFISRYYLKCEEQLTDSRYETRMSNVWLMGACLIMSREYMDARISELGRPFAFWPETNFYYEEALLGYYCKSKDMLTVYSPNIAVHHINGGATKSDRNNRSRIRFLLRNYYDASKVYLSALKSKKRL